MYVYVRLEQCIRWPIFLLFFFFRFVYECCSIPRIYWEHVSLWITCLEGGRFGLIYQIGFLFLNFCATLAHPEVRWELRAIHSGHNENALEHQLLLLPLIWHFKFQSSPPCKLFLVYFGGFCPCVGHLSPPLTVRAFSSFIQWLLTDERKE